MATKKSASASNVVTEYVLREGKQGVFSHGQESVVRSRYASLVSSNLANGKDSKYQMFKREVTYTDFENVPTGEEAIGAKGEVVETEIQL